MMKGGGRDVLGRSEDGSGRGWHGIWPNELSFIYWLLKIRSMWLSLTVAGEKRRGVKVRRQGSGLLNLVNGKYGVEAKGGGGEKGGGAALRSRREGSRGTGR